MDKTGWWITEVEASGHPPSTLARGSLKDIYDKDALLVHSGSKAQLGGFYGRILDSVWMAENSVLVLGFPEVSVEWLLEILAA